MATPHRLCATDDVKQALGIIDTVDDTQIDLAVQAASYMIEQYCERQFAQDVTTSNRIYVADSPWLVRTDDFATLTGFVLATDPGEDGSFSQAWTSSDYQLEPLNGNNFGEPWPYHTIRAIESLEFPMNYGKALVRVTAKWGWASIPPAVKQATVIQAITVFKSPDAPFGATPFADTGILRLRSALHPTAAALVAPYRLSPVMVG